MSNFAPNPKQVRNLKLLLIATLAVGALASLVARPVTVGVPDWAIAPLWTLAYGLMAVAAWLAWDGLKSFAFAVFVLQLALNLVWRVTPLPLPGLAMDLSASAALILLARRNLVAALAFLPCVMWSLFVSLPMIGFWRPG